MLVVSFDCVNKLYDRKWPTCKSEHWSCRPSLLPFFFPQTKERGKRGKSGSFNSIFVKQRKFLLNKGSSSKCVRQLNDWLTHRGSCVKRDLKGQNLLHDT